MLQRLVQLPQPEHKSTDGIRFCHPLCTLLLQSLYPPLCFFVPFHQPVVPGKIFILILRHPAVFFDTALDQLHHDLQIL